MLCALPTNYFNKVNYYLIFFESVNFWGMHDAGQRKKVGTKNQLKRNDRFWLGVFIIPNLFMYTLLFLFLPL